MISFPNCKINLGLRILAKRPDGYHDIESLFYPVKINDALEFIIHHTLILQSEGLEIPGTLPDNIVIKAYQIIKNDFPDLPCLRIALLKKIPAGAGLGGGSSNGAAMLKMLNSYFELQLSDQKLREYALKLGSDCPFFIQNIPAIATGRGEILKPSPVDLSAYEILLVNPGIHVATATAFSSIKPSGPHKPVAAIVTQKIETWKAELVNDFEQPVFKLFPVIGNLKSELYGLGAVYSSMSGSGSTVFGIFPKNALDPVQLEKKFTGCSVFISLPLFN